MPVGERVGRGRLQMNYWVLIYRCAWVALVALCVVGLVCIFLPECRTYEGLQDKRGRLAAETQALDLSIRDLQRKQSRMPADREFVERTARELGMAMPGETIYKVAPRATNEQATR